MIIPRISITSNSFRCSNILRHCIVFDDKMPTAYVEKDFHVHSDLKKSIYSIEHIFPRSLISKKDYNDMHNTIRTTNELNINRSNYKFTDCISEDKHWTQLNYNNHVNHKLKLFVPNPTSRGFISRAILYMSKEYDYNSSKIIDTDMLIGWFYAYPPQASEKYHNEIVKKLQNKNNIFISNYNKKSVLRYINSLQ